MKITALLVLAQAWELDLRFPYQETIYLQPEEQLKIVLGGNAGTGAKWMHLSTDSDMLNFVDSVYKYEEPELDGGSFKESFNFKGGVKVGVAELRFAFARPWEFDVELLKASTNEYWKSQVWESKILEVHVDANMKKIDFSHLKVKELGQGKVTVQVGDLVRVTCNDRIFSDFQIRGTTAEADAAIQIV